MTSLAEIREKLKKMESQQGNGGFDNAVFPFWNMSEGGTTSIRFLPDNNDDNVFFWVEKNVIRLPFEGVIGDDEASRVIVEVPCVEMWGQTCPILTEVRPMFKDASLEDTARKYWKKRSYIFQGFVQKTDLTEEEEPESPIRRFILGPQLFNIVKGFLKDPESEELPIDYTNGLDFKVIKGSKGNYADYSASNWARKPSSLTDEQLEAIEKYGLSDLSDFLPKKPDAEMLNVMSEMFEASIAGEKYDPDRWGNFYRPKGYNLNTTPNDDNASGQETNNASNSNNSVNEREEAQNNHGSVDHDDDGSDDNDDNNGNNVDANDSTEDDQPKNANDILQRIRERKGV